MQKQVPLIIAENIDDLLHQLLLSLILVVMYGRSCLQSTVVTLQVLGHYFLRLFSHWNCIILIINQQQEE